MKILHYNLYNNGNIGMCNLVMSVENAVIIAKLTGRDKIIFYGDGKLYNSEKLILPDLYDINFSYEWVSNNDINQEIPALPYDFFNTVIYYGEFPSNDFINKRTNFIDLKNWENVPEFRTVDKNTLAYYSYLFYLRNDDRKEIIEFVKETVKPKQKYLEYANHYASYLGSYNSLHFRRGDFKVHANERDRHIKSIDVLGVVKANMPVDKTLVVHSDESEIEFFDEFKSTYGNIVFIDKELNALNLDPAEKGLVSLLIAAKSVDFIGTMFSTFTGFIQRYRMYNGLKEDFKFLYSQDDNVVLQNGKFHEESFGQQTWNRLQLPERLRAISFWFREWPESYSQLINEIEQSLRIFPNFVSSEEIRHIIRKATANKTEFFERENRNRITIHVSQDRIIKGLIERACAALGYNPDNVEPSMQIFSQYEGGQTFWHTDSLYEDYQGKRISSVLFYLNEDFKGSYIDFPYIGVRLAPKTGTMLCYPLVNEFNEQDKRWSHSASIITEGVKHMCYFSLKELPYNKG